MRKFLVWPDGTKDELPPITYEEYLVLELWGTSNESWTMWLLKNNYVDVRDYLPEVLYKAILVFEEGEPSLLFFSGDDYSFTDDPVENYYGSEIKNKSESAQKFNIKSTWNNVSEEQGSDLRKISIAEMTIPEYNEKWNLKEWSK